MANNTTSKFNFSEMMGLYDVPSFAPLSKKDRAREAKVRERYEQKVGTVITATKETLLEVRRLRDLLTSDPRVIEREARKMRLSFASALPRDMGQSFFLGLINIALAGTPEGDIPDDWESSFTILSEDCFQRMLNELTNLAGCEGLDEAVAAGLRGEDPFGKGKDEEMEGVDMKGMGA